MHLNSLCLIGGPSNDLQNFERAIVGRGISPYRGSVAAPDVRALPQILGGHGMESVNTQHFDNMNYSKVVNNFKNINKGINDLLNQYGKGGINATQLGQGVGEYYHAIADFYSHSNYVELYESIYGQTSLDMIPTLEDVQSNSKYSKFSELLKTSLVTGEYPGEGEGSHKSMNHDLGAGSNLIFSNVPEVRNKKVNWNSRAAEAVATKATVQYHGKILKKVK